MATQSIRTNSCAPALRLARPINSIRCTQIKSATWVPGFIPFWITLGSDQSHATRYLAVQDISLLRAHQNRATLRQTAAAEAIEKNQSTHASSSRSIDSIWLHRGSTAIPDNAAGSRFPDGTERCRYLVLRDRRGVERIVSGAAWREMNQGVQISIKLRWGGGRRLRRRPSTSEGRHRTRARHHRGHERSDRLRARRPSARFRCAGP